MEAAFLVTMPCGMKSDGLEKAEGHVCILHDLFKINLFQNKIIISFWAFLGKD